MKILELLTFDSEIKRVWVTDLNSILLGVDEVGRGCFAGPVVAAAVQLPERHFELISVLGALDDSKKLTHSTRKDLAEKLKDLCGYAIAESSVDEIEKYNILQATFMAMNRAIKQLVPSSTHSRAVILVDGNQPISNQENPQIPVVKGDAQSASIAAASVLAKVYRDELMCKLHEEFPQYHWDENKGYGSKAHQDAIKKHGLNIWHRKTFCRNLLEQEKRKQLGLFGLSGNAK